MADEGIRVHLCSSVVALVAAGSRARDHIDGNRSNNREENLRWLCPNCHSQTPTFGKNKTKKKKEVSMLVGKFGSPPTSTD